MREDTPDDIAVFIDLLSSELGLDEQITPETPLITSGLIDSFDVVTLIALIESHYGVTIIPEQLDTTNFDTPRQMFAYVRGVV